MSHDDAAMYERAIKEGRKKETKGKDIRKMNCLEMPAMTRLDKNKDGSDVEICDRCEDTLKECICTWSGIRSLQAIISDHWDLNYKSIENISKRVSKVEDDIISLYRKIEFYEHSIQRKWQANTELSQRLTNLEEQPSYKQIIDDIIGEVGKLKSTKAEAALVADHYIKTIQRLDKIENELDPYDLSDHDERIHDLENIGAEKRLLKLERHFSGDYQLIASKLNPHKCPVCEGNCMRPNPLKGSENAMLPVNLDCIVCDGKGIVWG